MPAKGKKGKASSRPKKAAGKVKKAARAARITRATKANDVNKTRPAAKKTTPPTTCQARGEHDLKLCGAKTDGKLYCDDHLPQWDRSSHLKAGMPSATADLKNFDTCGLEGCDVEHGDAHECEGCPFTYHLACAPSTSRYIRSTEGENVFVCGTCVDNPKIWTMIPHSLRESNKSTGKRRRPDQASVDAFMLKASPEKKSAGKASGNSEDPPPQAGPDEHDLAQIERDTRRQELLSQLDELNAADTLATRLLKEKQLGPVQRRSPKRDDAISVSDSDDNSSDDSDDSDSEGSVKGPSPLMKLAKTLQNSKAASSKKKSVKRALQKSLALIDDLEKTRQYAHLDDECNDDECKIDKRDGEYDFTGGNRIDGAYEALLLLLLGPSLCSIWTPSQRTIIDQEQKDRNCTKVTSLKPVFSTRVKPDDSQVYTHLENLIAAYTALARNRARAGFSCSSRLALIDNIKSTVAAVRTIMTDQRTYGSISAIDYVQTLLDLAHRGADVKSNNTHGIPRHDVLSCLALRKSSDAKLGGNGGTSGHAGGNNTNGSGAGGAAGGKPTTTYANGNGGGSGGSNGGGGKNKKKKRCLNCEEHHGGTPTDNKHSTNDCDKPFKLRCGHNGCTGIHKRRDCPNK